MEKPEIIVDENDNVIGYKNWQDVDYTKDIYRISTLWIENSKSEVLLAQRKFTKTKDPGKWGPAVAGTIEQGETYEQNVYKEAEEEIGLTNTKLAFVAKYKVVTPRKYFVALYKASVDWPLEKFIVQEKEVEQIAWVPKGELLQDIEQNPEKYIPSMKQLLSNLPN